LADVYQAKPDTLRKPKNLEILLSIEWNVACLIMNI
jgi:hypothetical protein